MRLGARDAVATVFAMAGVLAALSVTAGWNWPLMNGVRMGIIVLGLAGMFACSTSGWGADVAERKTSWINPFMIVAILLGIVALVAALIGLFANTMIWLEVMILATLGIWVVTLIHRLFAGVAGRSVTAA